MDKKNNSLRASAEEQLQQASTTDSATYSAEELLYELQVHQIELEMQNENLRQSYDALAESQQDYFDLHEFAPIGYLTLSQQGLIEKINLTGAALLGKSRSQLLRRCSNWERLFPSNAAPVRLIFSIKPCCESVR